MDVMYFPSKPGKKQFSGDPLLHIKERDVLAYSSTDAAQTYPSQKALCPWLPCTRRLANWCSHFHTHPMSSSYKKMGHLPKEVFISKWLFPTSLSNVLTQGVICDYFSCLQAYSQHIHFLFVRRSHLSGANTFPRSANRITWKLWLWQSFYRGWWW